MKIDKNLEQFKCNNSLLGTKYNYNDTLPSCSPDFDRSLCWEETNANVTVSIECPFEFCQSCKLPIEERRVTRHCSNNGYWISPNYDKCREIYFNYSSCFQWKCNRCPGTYHELISIITIVLSLVSVTLLVVSWIIFSNLKSIQCTRLSLHKNLVAAFIIRFTFTAVWIFTQMFPIFLGCSSLKIDWLCKSILFVLTYATMASTFWMFVEGVYLVSRFTVFAMRSPEGHRMIYGAIGWALPFLFVSLWAAMLELDERLRNNCWLPYTKNKYLWLLIVPIIATLALNVLFLLVVIAILVQKLRNSNYMESNKIWRTIKATLFLVPLLGISNLLLFVEPKEHDVVGMQIYMLFSSILQHSQGIFVAVLYCFLNEETQTGIMRKIQMWRKSRDFPRSETAKSSMLSSSRHGVSDMSLNYAQVRNATTTNEDDEMELASRNARILRKKRLYMLVEAEGTSTFTTNVYSFY